MNDKIFSRPRSCKKFKSYVRFCDVCKNYFRTTMKCAYMCSECKKERYNQSHFTRHIVIRDTLQWEGKKWNEKKYREL